MKELKTIRGEIFLVDDEDYEKARQHQWTMVLLNGIRRVITNNKSDYKPWKNIIPYKELIFELELECISFKNDDPLDLRRENIVIFENKGERARFINSMCDEKTGAKINLSEVMDSVVKNSGKANYLGITYIPNLSPPWLATISYNKMTMYLGNFLQDEHAAIAYDKKVLELYGTNAKRNFPNLTLEELTKKLAKIKYAKNKVKNSKYMGVSLNQTVYSNARKWTASISYEGRRYYLGSFYTEEEAARAHDATAIELYGEDVKRNFSNLTLDELLEIDNIKAEDRISFFDRLEKRRPRKSAKRLETSQYIGVYPCYGKKEWMSVISYQEKQHNLGYYDVEEDAARAYDERALELYGEDAKLNFPRSNYNYRKELKTTCGKTILYDEEDYEKAKQYRWSLNTNGERYNVVTSFYDRERQSTNFFSYKDLILGIKSKWTLYKNDNPLDLRRENMMVFETQSECARVINMIYGNNSANRTHRRRRNPGFNINQSTAAQGRVGRGCNPKTNYFGIIYVPRLQRSWIAIITHNRKFNYLGSYTKDEYAALAYDQKALEIYGINAKRNFPDLTKEEIAKKLAKIKAKENLFASDNMARKLQGKLSPKKEKTSQYVGVCFNKRTSKWQAYIGRCKKVYRLGSFYTEEEAARVYDRKALELYGEDARLNFPLQ